MLTTKCKEAKKQFRWFVLDKSGSRLDSPKSIDEGYVPEYLNHVEEILTSGCTSKRMLNQIRSNLQTIEFYCSSQTSLHTYASCASDLIKIINNKKW